MMYPFMTLDDNTEIVHSEMQPDHRVKVYIEKPDEKEFPLCGLLSAGLYLGGCQRLHPC